MVSILFVGLIGCRAGEGQSANRSDLASNTSTDDPSQVCPYVCVPGILCQMPDGSCTAACNDCLCRRDGGRVVGACPKADSPTGAFQAAASQVVAASDVDRAR
ncbi:MAG TPA: hypothetical protein VF516_13990 [Kofleriaceae bacterium]